MVSVPSSSATTSPLTNAFSESLTHTHLLPEKSLFSPAIPAPKLAVLFRLSSVDLMKFGANVPGEPFGTEPLRPVQGVTVEGVVGSRGGIDCRWDLFGGDGDDSDDDATLNSIAGL
jgi:hypothetical protein